ncbi:MAG: ComF family protein [Prolixibacteraceae bacterium]|jgi:ComF family protein|nr:ComF family protein [Prolixibacteraceae bacterium]MBT6007182.1 ComF family protein [Prolixibacteraceae bacterium]MBT6763841.1 ComF family protein [Prolixibacteraceae bacterium]MBT7000593.1 ComF family protein [Prolixibacteraceae bacterium]MBT7396969.1 ComF family protein [Prolixibacteraceae bacterium]
MDSHARGLNDILELFFPSLCISCGDRLISQEKFLCVNCWLDLPVTNFHLNSNNKVAQLLWGRARIENASSFFSYKKGSKYQKLIHFVKYKGLKELGFETGRRFGFVLAESVNFNSVDLIVPVPLHPWKLKKRGYNQSEWIAMGMAESMNKQISSNNLFRKEHTSTQTRKNRFERWQNVEGIFGVNKPEEFSGLHILLIDDVITTGSTLEACAFQLLKIENTKVSIATLAFADF